MNADIDLVILFRNPDTLYPCKSREEYSENVNALINNSRYEMFYENKDLILFRKKGLQFSL